MSNKNDTADKSNENAEAFITGKKRSGSSLESSSNTKATKKHLLEFKWEIYREDDDYDRFSVFEDEVRDEHDSLLSMSRAVIENEEGENHEYNITICLVDGKSDDRRVLAEINVDFWCEGINLMHFNQKSQDLANFCRILWSASGRDIRHYSDMAIEFGDSEYSDVEIKELVEEVTVTATDWNDNIAYIQTATLTQGSTSNESIELLNRLFAVEVFAIAHRTDLENLGFASIGNDDIGSTNNSDINFEYASIGDGWFVIGKGSN